MYAFKTGTLTGSLQTFYVRYLSWLLQLPGAAIDQLLIGRVVMLVCEAITALAIFGVARQFAPRLPALLCALAYMTDGYVFSQAISFRGDPQVSAALMTALWILLSGQLSWRRTMATAGLIGLGGLISIKAVLYAPVFLGAAYLLYSRAAERKELSWKLLAILPVALCTFLVALLAHGAGLAEPPASSASRTLGSALDFVFSMELLPQAFALINQITMAPVLSLALLLSPLFWIPRFKSIPERLMMVSLLAPVLTILFYKNAYPYFFVFILAPAAVTFGPMFEVLLRRTSLAVVIGSLLLFPLITFAGTPTLTLETQRKVSDEVRRIFPRPVMYVDFCGIIGDFPRPFQFLTSRWGLRNYRERGTPLVAVAMAHEPVPLLIVNNQSLQLAVDGVRSERTFLPRDADAIRENFLPHWGPIWLAGKRIAPGASQLQIKIEVPGVYTVEGSNISIDGEALAVGDTVRLGRGAHEVQPGARAEAILRWGDHIRPPAEAFPEAPLFAPY